jgi:hypothetical protein
MAHVLPIYEDSKLLTWLQMEGAMYLVWLFRESFPCFACLEQSNAHVTGFP